MPELPEVETVCRGIAPALEGEVLSRVDIRRQDLRFPVPAGLAERLTGKRVLRVHRRGKYGLVDFESGEILIFHLGMSGRMRLSRVGEAAQPVDKHDHALFETARGDQLTFNDPRRFGFFDLSSANEIAFHPALSAMGPEPLARDFTGEALAARLAGRRTPIKAALLNQHVVAGIGNIYACEALNRARCSPRRMAATVKGVRAERLAAALKSVLERAIAAGGSSLKDHRRADGELGYFQHNFRAYRQEGKPCRSEGCDGRIRRIAQSGRASFYCPACQR